MTCKEFYSKVLKFVTGKECIHKWETIGREEISHYYCERLWYTECICTQECENCHTVRKYKFNF